VDPFFREVGRKWKEVGRLAGKRPVLGVVAKEQLTAHNVTLLHRHAANCKPEAVASAAEVKKLRDDLAASRAEVKELKKGIGGGGKVYGGSMETWQKANQGKCYFWSMYETCKFGSKCKESTQPGHPQEPVLTKAK